MFFWDVGMLGCWCSFHDFVGSVFGSVFGRMIIGAGVDFFLVKHSLVQIWGSQYLQNWVVLVLWVAFLFTFFVFEENTCFKAFAMADDDHDDEELHWTSLNTDWCGSRGTLQPCSLPKRIGPYLVTPGASEKRVGKESEVKVGAMDGVSLWRCDVFFSNARQGVQIKLVWSPNLHGWYRANGCHPWHLWPVEAIAEATTSVSTGALEHSQLAAAGGPAVCFLDQGSAVASTAAKGQTADDQVPNRSRIALGCGYVDMIITILFFSKYFHWTEDFPRWFFNPEISWDFPQQKSQTLCY